VLVVSIVFRCLELTVLITLTLVSLIEAS